MPPSSGRNFFIKKCKCNFASDHSLRYLSSLSLFLFFLWEILEIFLQSTHNSWERRNWKKRRFNWYHWTTSAQLKVVQCPLHPKPKQILEERKPTDAPCVPPRLPKLVIWNDTFLFIPEKSRSAAISVSTNAHRKVTSRHTCGHIQETSLLAAHSVNSPAQHLVTSRHTCWHIQERSISGVSSVTFLALELKVWRLTSSHTLEKSLLHVSSAASLPVTQMV